MPTVVRFEELESWKLSRELCAKIGQLIDSGKLQNNYALIRQMEGSSGSIMDNIAEGFERGSRGETISFLAYAKASCAELRSQLYRAWDRNYITAEQFQEFHRLTIRIGILLHKFILYLRHSPIAGIRKKE